MVEIRETPAYASWFGALRDRTARARINIRIRRLSLGNSGDIHPVGDGISELRIHYGPGYRIYLTSKEMPSSFCLQVATRVPKTRIFVSPRISLEISRRVQ
jgi:putative addiction module killer protein